VPCVHTVRENAFAAKEVITWVSWLEHEGIGLKSLQEVIDTTSPSGKLTFHIFAALAEFERQLIHPTMAERGREELRGEMEAADLASAYTPVSVPPGQSFYGLRL
jgi:DNA invertase Pin-like site-specific DNA recombinase